MNRTRIVRGSVIAICVLGIAGMIVTSAMDRNGAAITFGLITAVAILCQMVATTIANDQRGEQGRAPHLGEELEARIAALVRDGADEVAMRDLVREAVRLGRTTTNPTGLPAGGTTSNPAGNPTNPTGLPAGNATGPAPLTNPATGSQKSDN